MGDKNGICAFILKILIQILNFILSKITKGKKSSTENSNIEYKQDEQENTEMKEKINGIIKDKLGNKEAK